jgi:hypothetical protein
MLLVADRTKECVIDHKGNVFVAEWVEVHRVSKLRKVA